MSQEDVFKYLFLYRRVKLGKKILYANGHELRVGLDWNRSTREEVIKLVLVDRTIDNNGHSRWQEKICGYSYPDGKVWVYTADLDVFRWRTKYKIERWLEKYCIPVIRNENEVLYRIKPFTRRVVVGSVDNGTAFGERLVSKYGSDD